MTGLLRVDLHRTEDLVRLRERGRRLARLTGLSPHAQVSLVAALSEVSRHALRESGRAVVEFAAFAADGGPLLTASVTDPGDASESLREIIEGTGVAEGDHVQGLLGARRLSDFFRIEPATTGGTVTVGMRLPLLPGQLTDGWRSSIASEMTREPGASPLEELQRQNRELVATLEALSRRTADVERLNAELAETNRGVLALYAELDDRAESLREASVAKSRFVSDASHELRTPLNAIISLTGLLLDRTDGDLSEEQTRQVAFIRSSALSLVELVSGMLDLAKIEAGRIELRLSVVQVADLLGALRGMFRVMVPEAVTLHVDEPATPAALITDEGKVAQILRNLVANALKFTQTGLVQVVADIDDEHLHIRVADTGIGIAASDLDRIFEDFTQVDAPLQRRFRGTGLGLPLARRLARLLGGDVSATSTPGAGSTFILRLPLAGPPSGGDASTAGSEVLDA